MYTLHKIYILALLSLFTASNSHADSIRNSRRTAVVEAVERIQPSVVSLHVRYRERVSQLYQFRGDPFLNFFSPNESRLLMHRFERCQSYFPNPMPTFF